jgi:predicted CoA-binding protein
MPTTIPGIREFLALRRIALVGLSRNPKDFSRMLFRDMCAKGYDMVPVNPTTRELEGRPCFARVLEINPPVQGALLLTSPRETERVVRDCAEAGIRHVWMHRSGGDGSVSQEAMDFCHKQGMHLVEGQCPFMFLRQTGFVHRVHGLIRKLTRTYPPEAQHAA